MKTFKLLFVGFLFLAFLVPNVANAKTISGEPAFCPLTIDGVKYWPVDAMVKISASGNLHLTATFDLSSLNLNTKNKGVIKFVADRLAVEMYSGVPENYHFQAFNVKVKVNPDGIASVVYNWQIIDEY